jgi:invasion protein IalB
MLVSIAIAAMLAASSAPAAEAAPAQTPTPAATPVAPAGPTKAAVKEEKLICKYEAETGSRFSKKICLTESQFKARRDESRKAVSDIQTNAGIAP